MALRRSSTRRVGFSLIEVLIVIGILGLLAALAAAAYFRVGASQRVSATEATVSKIAMVLDKRRSAVVDAAMREPIPPDIVTFAGDDMDRARAVWLYMRLKEEFPTTRAEATSNVAVSSTVLPHRRIFDALPAGTYPSLEHESAACLYLALTATGSGGMVTDLEGLQGQTMTFKVGATDVTAFADAWGKPIAFSRLTFSTELDSPNYANTRSASKDPIDPLRKLPGLGANLTTFWTRITQNHLPSAAAPTTYPTRNHAFAVVSAGPDESFGNPLIGDNDAAADNIVSYRLKAGHKGQ